MIFSEQLSSLRKKADMTQEALAEKCDVSRQAVAKWECGESIPDIYKLSQIATIFNVSLEELVWGADKHYNEEQVAKNIYSLFVENMESLRSKVMEDRYSSSTELATKLRAEIKKARVIFPRRIVDDLMQLSSEFGVYIGDILGKAEYKEIISDTGYKGKNKKYCEFILPQKYDAIENLLGDYIKFPK